MNSSIRADFAGLFGGAIYAPFWGKDLEIALGHVSFLDNQARQGGAIEFEGSLGSNRRREKFYRSVNR